MNSFTRYLKNSFRKKSEQNYEYNHVDQYDKEKQQGYYFASRNTSKGSLSRNKTRAVKYKFGHLFAEIDKSKDDNSCKSHFSLYKNSRDCNKELDRETQEVDEILEDSNMQCHIEARMDTSPRDNPAILKLIPHLASLGSNNVR